MRNAGKTAIRSFLNRVPETSFAHLKDCDARLSAKALSVLPNWNSGYYQIIREDETIPRFECVGGAM